MSLVAGCFSCEQERLGESAPRSERIWVGTRWRVVHAVHCALPGWLILVPRRHVEAMAELSADEAVELGRLQVAVSAALHEVVGCEKTYVVQFAEAAGFAHTHVHVIPRAADLPEQYVGPGVFGYLDRPEAEWVAPAVVRELVDRLEPAVARIMAGVRFRRRVAPVLALLALAGCSSGGGAGSADTPSDVTAPRASGSVALPPANGQFDYQLGGPYEPDASVRIVDRDRTAPPVPGRYNVCYVNAFQSQPGEKAFWFDQHPDLLLRVDGQPVSDPGWPGEYIFDLTTTAKRAALAEIVGGWIDGCAAAGFQAVEPDNLDAYTRSKGGYGEEQALAFAALLTRRAHHDGLAIGQKNGGDLGTKGRDAGFDFAVVEECQVFEECGDYTDVYGDQVYEIEYTDNGEDAYAAACSDHGARISVILRDREVVPRGDPAYVYESC